VILLDLDGGWEMVTVANKLEAFDFTFDWSGPTFWVVLFGGLAANLISYGSDQSVIQRYLTTRDEKAAARSIWTNGILCIPASLLFFSVGTALFVYYKSHPQMLNPFIENPDAVFPWFIVSMLPQGVAGLVIAAVFAASMSSLDSSMNSISAAVTTDFFRRFKPDAPEKTYLGLARWITVIVGLGGTAFALMLAGWGIQSLWDQFFVFIGLFAGGLGGLFLLGIFTRRAGGAAALAGLIASGVVQYLVKQYTDIHFLLYTFTGMVSCLVVGGLAGLVAPAGKNEGLTVHTVGRKG
jgi:Na+/proline symporter